MNNEEIQALKDGLGYGVVSSVDKATMTAKVKIESRGIVSTDLHIVQNTPLVVELNKNTQQEIKIYPWVPYVGQKVLCLFIPDGDGDGFILGGI